MKKLEHGSQSINLENISPRHRIYVRQIVPHQGIEISRLRRTFESRLNINNR